MNKNRLAWVYCPAFLTLCRITGFNEHTTNSQNAIAYLHQQLIAEAKRRKTDGQALILMSHAHMQGGNFGFRTAQLLLAMKRQFRPACLMTALIMWRWDIYIKPQKVGQDHIRYSGSQFPCPLVKSTISTKWSKSRLIRPNQKISWTF